MLGDSTVITHTDVKRYFKTVPEVLKTIKDEFDHNDNTDYVDWMMNTDILFLDDLGTEKASDWVKEQLYMVINERYSWNRPIVITTNLEMSEIAESYGDRFASRLTEMCEVVKYKGNDKRVT